MGSQFHFDVPLVEQHEKQFKIGVTLTAEKKMANQPEEQKAELRAELALKDKTMVYGKIGKGSIEGRLHHGFSKRLTVDSNFLNSNQGKQIDNKAHYKGKDFTVGIGYLHAGNPQAPAATNAYTLSYMQSITPTISLGSKCQHSQMGPQGSTELLFMGQYKHAQGDFKRGTGKGDVVTAEASTAGSFKLGYTKQFTPQFGLVTEINAVQLPPGHPSGRSGLISSCSAGCKYVGNTYQYFCVVESTGTVNAYLNQVCLLNGTTLVLSGQMNHWTNQSRFGIGLKLPNGFG